MRGFVDCTYHADILSKFEKEELTSDTDIHLNWKAECIGGGRIATHETDKRIIIYGSSEGFGPADHAVTEQLLKESFPTYSISFQKAS